MSRYEATQIEAKWQAAWDNANVFEAKRDEATPKYYVLEMFPYPSGRIHMGHVRNYTMGDVIARYKNVDGPQCVAPNGLGRLWHARRKRGHGNWGSPQRMDIFQHRNDERSDEATWAFN